MIHLYNYYTVVILHQASLDGGGGGGGRGSSHNPQQVKNAANSIWSQQHKNTSDDIQMRQKTQGQQYLTVINVFCIGFYI